MRFDQIVLLALAGFICLAPLTVYLLWLGVVLRRPWPTVIAGRWDFTALFLALLGFLLFGGGLLLTLIYPNSLFALRGNKVLLEQVFAQERSHWLLAAGAYSLMIAAFLAWEFFSRRRSLVIYNASTSMVEQTIEEILDASVQRKGNIWFENTQPLLRLDAHDAGRTATLQALGTPLQFQEIERHLRQRLPSLAAPENIAALWIRAAALSGSVITALCFAVLLLLAR